MTSPQLPSMRRISLSWLMWLALLVPLAQSAAAWHSASHGLSDAAGHEAGRKAVQAADHCDLCLTAASLGGSAPVADAMAFELGAGGHALPVEVSASVWIAPTLTVYSSRAPPPDSR